MHSVSRDMRVLLLNNYEMDGVLAEWQEGLCPAHHLWGASHLSAFGIESEILPFERFPQLNRRWRVQRALNCNSREMIALDQQVRALIHRRTDVIYAACQDHTFLLARLRHLGLLRKPIVTTIHHPIAPHSVEERLLNAHDLVFCLSRVLRDQILARDLVSPEKLVVVDWAPDLDFYGPFVAYESQPKHVQPVIISAGKSNRDYDTLVDGSRGLSCRLEIFCSSNSAPSVVCDPAQVKLTVGARGSNATSHVEMRAEYARAYAIAIPMPAVDRLSGLTSLLDAMAIGRPVIMTRNRYIDIDIEALGFGIWVDAGDTEGWRAAIRSLIMDPQRAREMGRRARQATEERYNLMAYAESVARSLRAMHTAKWIEH
jgi:glycosyltransferase involved in cell wall biosynthesis